MRLEDQLESIAKVLGIVAIVGFGLSVGCLILAGLLYLLGY